MQKISRREGRPTLEEAARINETLLVDARAIFCLKGISGASMDEIAAACGLTKQAIYRRYRSKLELVDAVVQRDITLLGRVVKPDGSDPNPWVGLRDIAYRYYRHSAAPQNASFTSFLLAESARSEEMRKTLGRWSQLYLAPMISFVELAQRKGSIQQGAPRDICLLLTDLLGTTNHLHRFDQGNITDADSSDRFFEARWEIFCKATQRDSEIE